MWFMGLSKAEKKKLKTEVVSNEARLKLTRLMRHRCNSTESNIVLINRNRFINIARTVLNLPIYRLEPDDEGMYMSEEFGWHLAETELVMRRPDTAQLIEILGDMVQENMLDMGAVNRILAVDSSSVRFVAEGFDEDISVHILAADEIEEESDDAEHPNIRLLVERMETVFGKKDYAGVLHASATVFETLAKLVFDNPAVEDQTLAAMFDGYRKRSGLPEPLLDYILTTYRRRNSEPLAGHGATKAPSVTAQDAATLVEMTKMCVRLERRLAVQELDSVPVTAKGVSKATSVPQVAKSAVKPQPVTAKAGKVKKLKKKKKARDA